MFNTPPPPPSEISKTLDDARVPRSINSISREPNAGEKIPERFRDLLKHDINYHLRDGEWVGYEVSEEDEENDEVYIYMQRSLNKQAKVRV